MNRLRRLSAAHLGYQLRFLATRRSLRLTSEGTRFLLFTIGIGVAAVNTGNNLFYLLLAMMLSVVVISGLLSEQCLRRLDFRRHVPDLLMANQPTTVTLCLPSARCFSLTRSWRRLAAGCVSRASE